MQDPVCTPEGFLFSKEAIIENLIQQKKAIKRKHAAWEAQQVDDQQKVHSPARQLHALPTCISTCFAVLCLGAL